MSKPKILVILGPTASGKSDLAVRLAQEFNGEVVSADSRQVYRGLEIGTGKITEEDMRGIPHHLLDVADPQDQYTVAEYKEDAENVINDIISRGKLPIIAGGTGFYIQAIVDGITPPEVPPNKELRKKLGDKSTKELLDILETLDARRAKEIEKENPRRLIRAVEIAKELGKVPKVEADPRYEALQIGLKLPKEELRQRINKRLQNRIEEGMIEEAEKLHDRGLSYKRMEELGLEYRYVARFLQGQISKDEMIEELQNKIWQYSRRQVRWFKRDERTKWFELDEMPKIRDTVQRFVK